MTHSNTRKKSVVERDFSICTSSDLFFLYDTVFLFSVLILTTLVASLDIFNWINAWFIFIPVYLVINLLFDINLKQIYHSYEDLFFINGVWFEFV